MISLNNLLILKPYVQGQGLKKEIKNGFAMIQQKTSLEGLEVLVDAKVDGTVIPAGSIAYIPEDMLSTKEWAKQVRKAAALEQEFIIVESRYVTFIDTKEK